jgi:putative transposase
MAKLQRLTYKYRLYPSKSQVTDLNLTFDVCRQVYNAFVQQRTVRYAVEGKAPSYLAQKRSLAAWKPEHPELNRVHSQVLQNVAKRVDLAFDAFFRRVAEGAEEPGYPRLKGRNQYSSITYPQSGFKLGLSTVWLSLCGRQQQVKARIHRPPGGEIKTCTVRRDGAKWYVCFSCEVQHELLPYSEESVGIDVGLKVFAALSNGEMIENPRFFRREQNNLSRAQRRFDKVKNKHRSPQRRKAKKVVARIHERIRNRRHNFIHQEGRKLVNRFGLIAIEDLAVSNMKRAPRAKPDPANIGQYLPNGASRKAGLNKSISDAAWSMFRSALTMKAENAGRKVRAVPPAYTSQMCSGCGNIVRKLLSERVHVCERCGLRMDRDTNASINILALGQQCVTALAV